MAMKYDAEDHFRVHRVFDKTRFNLISDSSLKESFGGYGRDHVAMIGCFRPRRCGIATFTTDVYEHLLRAVPDITVDIYAMRRSSEQPGDPAITMVIDEADRASYHAAAEAINRSGAGVVWLQHEFGIFGGPAGDIVLDLVERIAPPLVVTLHTILAYPADEQRRVMEKLVARAARLVVMSAFGRETLIKVYGADPASVVLIEHGTPDRPFVEMSRCREALGLGSRPVLSTFGLIGPGKGLEAAIRALPAIAQKYPDIIYRIVGATHPDLVATEGEAYRQSLEYLATSLGVEGNIAWENRFLDTEELLDQIEMCDIYVAPYPNLEQITSGTLAYAVALGRAVISTPFVHARELLVDDVGVLLANGSSESIAEAVLTLLTSPSELKALQKRAYHRGRQTAWPEIADNYAMLLAAVVPSVLTCAPRIAPSLAAVRSLSDGVGILQHSQHIVPDRTHGYCIDDNARALMLEMSLPLDRQHERQAIRYAAFIQHAWNPGRNRFRNFMGYDRIWLEEAGSEDSNGRALWALGHCAGKATSPDLASWGLGWFEKTAFIAEEFVSPRSVAFAMLGACEVHALHPDNTKARAIIDRGAKFLISLWEKARSAGWDWFETGLAYDNARLAEALIRGGRVMAVPQVTGIGIAALDWLCDQQTGSHGQFRPVGSEGFGRDGVTFPFDQQPIEAWATIDACAAALCVTGRTLWSERAEKAWCWFYGANDRREVLADAVTGRCRDGLTPRGINANVGAESVLAFHLAYQTMNTRCWSQLQKERTDFADGDLPTLSNAPAYS